MKLPWEKDPNDREANYKRPVPRAEVFRIAVKFVAAGAGFLWFRAMTDFPAAEPTWFKASGIGALAAAAGSVAIVASVVDLISLRRGEIEQIFLPTKRAQALARFGLLTLGVTMLVFGAARLP